MHVAAAVLLAACSTAVFAEENIFNTRQTAATCPNNVCPTGYTGRYCDQLLCDQKGTVAPPPGSGGAGIDKVALVKCDATITVPVDSHVTNLFISVDGVDNTARPGVVVKTAAGAIVTPSSTILSTNKTVQYKWDSPPAGYLYATVLANTGCVYSADAQTTFSAAVGFTYGSRSSHLDNPSSKLTEFQLATMVFAFRNLPAPGNAHKAEVFAQSSMVASYHVQRRYGCAYYDFIGPISCDSTKNWYFKLHGTDENGFAFMRTSVFPCVSNGPVTTTTSSPVTTPTTPAPGGCLHGGTPDPATGKCVCEFDWTGTYCQTAICFNGGTPTTDGTVCACATGYGGFHCDATICSSRNTEAPYTGQQLTIGIVIQATTSMAGIIQGIKSYAPELIETFNQQHPNFVKQYQLVTFDDKGATLLSSAHDPLITLSHIENLQITNGTVRCKKMLNQALNLALNIPNVGAVPKFSTTYVFTDSPPDLTDTHASLAAIGTIETTKNKVNFFYTPQSACQALNSTEVQRIFDLAEFSGGQVYYTKNPPSAAAGFKLANVLTTAYLNARAFDRYDADCTVRRTAYVPIDSHTAAFTFSVAGNAPSVVVQSPTGVIWPTVPIVDDEYVQVQQAVSPCTSGWDQFDNFCFKGSETVPTGWNQAQTNCRLSGATLGNVLNAQRQTFLDRETNGIDYLIGLNDQQYQGTYVWDSIADPAIPMLAYSYKNWGPGEPSSDTTKRCTIVKHVPGVNNGNGMWYKINCDTPKSSICQKPALNFYNNGLPAGIWRIDYQTRQGGDWGKQCLAKVDVQSDLQANWAFTTNSSGQFNDLGVPEPSSKSSNNRVISQVTGLGDNSYVAQVQLFQEGSGPLISSSPLFYRIGCLYNFYSSEFSCPKNAFGIQFSGHDEKGYTFERNGYGICIGASPTDNIITEDVIKGLYPMKF